MTGQLATIIGPGFSLRLTTNSHRVEILCTIIRSADRTPVLPGAGCFHLNFKKSSGLVLGIVFPRGMFATIFLLLISILFARADNLSIDSFVIGDGGGFSEGADYEVIGTIGQPATGEIGDDSSRIQNGFWNETIIDGAIYIAWAGGDNFLWQLHQTDGNPGWTVTNIIGTLGITAETAHRFGVLLQTLNASEHPGEAVNWLNTGAYAWTIATASYGISGFSPDKFDLVTNDFFNPGRGGTFSLEQSGNSVVLRFSPLRALPDFGERPDAAGTKINVLGNDLLNGGAPSISVGLTSAAGGALSKVGGFVFYTPPEDNPLSDSFTYTLSDGAGHSAVSTVVITVRGVSNGQSSNIMKFSGTAGNFNITFAGIPGLQYRVQWAPFVNGPWTDLALATAGNNGLFSLIDSADHGPQAYYRTASP